MGDEATGSADGTAAAPEGIDAAGVEAWFARARPRRRAAARLRADRRRPLEPDLPGHRRRRGSWALRRPPLGKRLGSAHDMGREHKVVSALGATDGAGGAGGRPLRGRERQRRALLRDGVRRGADPARPGRGRDLPRRGRPAGDRRARRRHPGRRSTPSTPTPSGSATSAARRTTSPASCAAGRASGRSRRRASWRRSTASTSASSARIPEQGPATIVHGDYRLDNMILTPSGEVAAVVDWELCTLGDPLADVGLLMAYWPERGEATTVALGQPANLAPGFPTRERARRPLRRALRPRPLRARLLRRPRLLEAGDHPRGRLRPLRGRRLRQGRRRHRGLRPPGRAPGRGRRGGRAARLSGRPALDTFEANLKGSRLTIELSRRLCASWAACHSSQCKERLL